MSQLKKAGAERIWFGGLLMVAAAARLYNFTHPVDDAHEWRQTQTLMYSASYAHGAGLLTPYSNWTGVPAHYGVLEFPIYSILAYWLSAVVDLVTAGRLISFACSVAAVFVFDRLCVAFDHPRRRVATLLFAFTPLAIFYGHATQPESVLILLVLATAYFCVRSQANWRWAIAAALCLAIAATIKPTALVVLAPPAAYLAWRRGGWIRQGAVLAFASVAVVAWAVFVRNVLTAADPSWYQINTNPSWVLGPLSLRFNGEFYLILLSRLFVLLLPPLSAVFIVVALRARAGHPFWWWWMAGSLASVLIFANLNEIHFYYQLPAVPGLVALAAHGAPRVPSRLLGRLALAIALVAASFLGSISLFREQPVYVEAGAALAAASSGQPSLPVVAISHYGGSAWFPTVLFYAGRDGWNLPPGSDAAKIAELPGSPPCWLVIVSDDQTRTAVPTGWSATNQTTDYVVARNQAC